MRTVFIAWLATVFLCGSVQAADKIIRIGFPDLAAQFVPLPLGEKRGFLKEEGVQGEFIRIRPAVSSAALVSGDLDYDRVLGTGSGAAIRGIPVKVLACFLPCTRIPLTT